MHGEYNVKFKIFVSFKVDLKLVDASTSIFYFKKLS
jgi:hypothetical protein